MKQPTLEEIECMKETSMEGFQSSCFYSCHNNHVGYDRIDEIFEWIKSKLNQEEL